MDKFVEFLNQHNSLLTLAFTGVVALSTVVYVILTRSLVRETKAMRQVYTNPKIDFTIRGQKPHLFVFDAYVQNIGQGPAHNIRFHLEPLAKNPETVKAIKRLNSNRFISQGINYLSPGQSMDAFMDWISQESNCFAIKLQITITYYGSNGVKFSDLYQIDMSEHEREGYVANDRLYEINDNLSKIAQSLENIASGKAKLFIYPSKHDNP